MSTASVPNDATKKQFVIFLLGETEFAVPIEQVWRIVPLEQSTRVPRVPAFIEGIINLHGNIVPVVDLKKRLGLPETPYGEEARIVVVDAQGHQVGMMVDEVSEILWLPEDSIEPPPAMIADISGVYLTGVAFHDNRLFVILDLSRVLSTQELKELETLT